MDILVPLAGAAHHVTPYLRLQKCRPLQLALRAERLADVVDGDHETRLNGCRAWREVAELPTGALPSEAETARELLGQCSGLHVRYAKE